MKELSESRSSCDESRQGASNCIAGIGQSAAEEGGKADRGCCKSDVVGTVGGLLHNNKNNNKYVRPCARVSASPDAVYGIPFETVVEAWIECEMNKRSSASAIRFRWHSARELVKLWGQICSCEYEPLASKVFMVHRPVGREIWAASFRDRVVHHWEAKRYYGLIDEYIRESGDRSFNCRKGYGNLLAVRTFCEDLRNYTDGYGRDDCWIVGGDFCNFFMSIDKALLWDVLERLVTERYEGGDIAPLLYLMRVTLMHRCQDNYYRIGSLSEWRDLPDRKSLFHMDGIPIGNLPSQLWANLLGSIFMGWMIGRLGGGRFVLFVDDWRALVRTPEEGRRLISDVREWLRENLHITLHPDKIYLQHYKKGTKLTGTVVKPGRVYVSNRTRAAMISRLQEFNARWGEAMKSGKIKEGTLEHWRVLEKVRSSVNSYLGIMSHFDSYNIRRRILLEHFLPTWGRWFYIPDGMRCVKLRGRHDLPRQLRKRLKNRDYAAKFIRPTYSEEE